MTDKKQGSSANNLRQKLRELRSIDRRLDGLAVQKAGIAKEIGELVTKRPLPKLNPYIAYAVLIEGVEKPERVFEQEKRLKKIGSAVMRSTGEHIATVIATPCDAGESVHPLKRDYDYELVLGTLPSNARIELNPQTRHLYIPAHNQVRISGPRSMSGAAAKHFLHDEHGKGFIRGRPQVRATHGTDLYVFEDYDFFPGVALEERLWIGDTAVEDLINLQPKASQQSIRKAIP